MELKLGKPVETTYRIEPRPASSSYNQILFCAKLICQISFCKKMHHGLKIDTEKVETPNYVL